MWKPEHRLAADRSGRRQDKCARRCARASEGMPIGERPPVGVGATKMRLGLPARAAFY